MALLLAQGEHGGALARRDLDSVACLDYLTQRTELVVSLCYVATLYFAARAWDAAAIRTGMAWCAAAVAACLLGMASKEVMITAPIAVVLYDLAFHRDAMWTDALARRRRLALYAVLCATSIPLLVAVSSGARADSVGFGLGVTWYQYLYSQAWAVAHYLRLAVWPSRLTFDYGQRPISGWSGVPGAVLLSGLLTLSIYSWRRRPRLAFLGCVFFLLLAPSSSIVPIRTEIAAERRMYLALVPVIAVVVLGAWTTWQWIAARGVRRWGRLVVATAPAMVLAALAVATALRSRVYADSEQLWRDTIRNAPTNARAYDQLAATLLTADSTRTEDARQLYATAIMVDSSYPYAWTNLADVEMKGGRASQAQMLLEHVLHIVPGYVDATRRLGGVLLFEHDDARAVPLLESVARVQPTVETLGDLATAYSETGRTSDAERTLEQLLSLDPSRTDALQFLAALLIKDNRADAAIDRIGVALRSDSSATLLALMATAQAQTGHVDVATSLLTRANELAPDDSNIKALLAMATRAKAAQPGRGRTPRAGPPPSGR